MIYFVTKVIILQTITKIKAHLYIVSAGILWGMISIFNILLTNCGYSQIEIVFIRSFVALFGMVLYVLIKDKSLFRIKIKDLWCFVGTGLVSLLLFNICYFNAMQENISAAAVLLYTAPAFVMIMSALLFKEKFTSTKIISLLIMILGCILVSGVTAGTKLSIACITFGICSGIGYALYSIFGRYALNKGYTSETITLYTFMMAVSGCIPMVSFDNIIYSFNMNAVIGGIGIGILCCLLPYLLYTKGLMRVKNSQASIMATVEPIVATVISIFYGDYFGWNNAVGIVLVLFSIVIINIDK